MAGAYCSIIGLNYLPFVRVLANSLKKFNSEEIYVLVLDADYQDYDLSHEAFNVLSTKDIGLTENTFLEMATSYDVMELATALKPFLITYLLKKYSWVTYLDPDICVFDNLIKTSAEFNKSDLVLIPHVLSAMPKDDCHPTEEIILASGIYNLGFISVAQTADFFLEMWANFTKRHCISDISNGLFVDQRFCDIAPVLTNCKVLREPQYDVAYWNLYERSIKKSANDYLVNGNKLGFFHFSGFDPEKPYILSKHELGKSRINLKTYNNLIELLIYYSEEVIRCGYGQLKDVKYPFSIINLKYKLEKSHRRLYRRALLLKDLDETLEVSNPFLNLSSFIKLANEPVSKFWKAYNDIEIKNHPEIKTSLLSWYLFEYWLARPDLQKAFPLALTDQMEIYLNWAQTSGLKEGIWPELIFN
jgi:hypothetical protein